MEIVHAEDNKTPFFAIDSSCFLLLINRVAQALILFNWTVLSLGDFNEI